MKPIGILLVLTTGILWGLYASLQLNRRVKVLTLTEELLSFLNIRIAYTATPIGELLQEAAREPRFRSLSVLTEMVKTLPTAPLPTAWRQGIEAGAAEDGFNREDAALLLRIGDELGKTDLAGQSSHLMMAHRQIAERREEAGRCAATKGKLYRTLGFSLGAATALLFI